jgi:hypothetical protein
VAKLRIPTDLFFERRNFLENVDRNQRYNLKMPLQIRTQRMK